MANWTNWLSILMYFAIVLITCLTTALTALFCSVLFRKTSHSLLCSYFIILVLFCGPVASTFFATQFFPKSPSTPVVASLGAISPVATTFQVPFKLEALTEEVRSQRGLAVRGILRAGHRDPGWDLVCFDDLAVSPALARRCLTRSAQPSYFWLSALCRSRLTAPSLARAPRSP